MSRCSVSKMNQAGIPAAMEREEMVTPIIDIYETEAMLILTAELPGVEADGVEITLDKDILTINAKGPTPPDGKPCLKEFRYGPYYRQFRLTDAVDGNKVSADLSQGVLTLSLSKAEEAAAKQIKVTTVH